MDRMLWIPNFILRNPDSSHWIPVLGVSWCCESHSYIAFVLWAGYCSVSFQSCILRH